MKKYNLLLTLVCTLFILSCTKELDDKIIEEEPIDTVLVPVFTEASLLIHLDGNEYEGEDVSAFINDVEYKSNKDGFIEIQSDLFNKFGQVIEIQSAEFYDELKFVIPSLGADMYLDVFLEKKNFDSEFDAMEGGAVQVKTGHFITFPSSSVMDADGNDYFGKVLVAFKSKLSALYASRIGSFNYNLSFQENQVAFNIAGGMQMELQSDLGEPLFIKSGKKIYIDLPVKEIELSIPDDLVIYSFDEHLNDWVFLQDIEKSQDRIHFESGKWQNLIWGTKHNVTRASFQLKSISGLDIEFNNFLVYYGASNPLGYGFTDAEGMGRAYVPTDDEYAINTFRLCETPQVFMSYPAIQFDGEFTEIGDFEIDDADIVTVSGMVVDCNDEPITNAVLEINNLAQGRNKKVNSDGTFEFSFFACNGDKKLTIYDFETNSVSEEFTISEIGGNLGQLKVCN